MRKFLDIDVGREEATRAVFGKSAELLGVGEIGDVVPSPRLQVTGSTNRLSAMGRLRRPMHITLVLNL
jgi:hypothetical protein